jgi:hypothetical protein
MIKPNLSKKERWKFYNKINVDGEYIESLLYDMRPKSKVLGKLTKRRVENILRAMDSVFEAFENCAVKEDEEDAIDYFKGEYDEGVDYEGVELSNTFISILEKIEGILRDQHYMLKTTIPFGLGTIFSERNMAGVFIRQWLSDEKVKNVGWNGAYIHWMLGYLDLPPKPGEKKSDSGAVNKFYSNSEIGKVYKKKMPVPDKKGRNPK